MKLIPLMLAVTISGIAMPSAAETRIGVISTATESCTGPLTSPSTLNASEIYDEAGELAADALLAAKGPFEIAKEGGKHAGFLKNYQGRSASEIQKGIGSIEKQIAEHQAKIANPEKFIQDWAKLQVPSLVFDGVSGSTTPPR